VFVPRVAVEKHARMNNDNPTRWYGKRTSGRINATQAVQDVVKLRRNVPDEIDGKKIACARIDYVKSEVTDGGPISVNGVPWFKCNTIRVTIRGSEDRFTDRADILRELMLVPGTFVFLINSLVSILCFQVIEDAAKRKDFGYTDTIR
jgi:hypothetical protein